MRTSDDDDESGISSTGISTIDRVSYDNDKKEILHTDEADSNVRSSVAVAVDINASSSHWHIFS